MNHDDARLLVLIHPPCVLLSNKPLERPGISPLPPIESASAGRSAPSRYTDR
jgi:hypothetical protein